MRTFHDSMISGARYHLVATYSVMKPAWFSSGWATRANPKSHTCVYVEKRGCEGGVPRHHAHRSTWRCTLPQVYITLRMLRRARSRDGWVEKTRPVAQEEAARTTVRIRRVCT